MNHPADETGNGPSGLERLRTMLEQGLRPGMAETLDIRLVAAEEGHVTLEAVPDTHLYNTMGTVHGGFAATILDFACGYATMSRLAPLMGFTTLELKVAYHRPVTAATGTVRAEGKVVSMGRRAAFTEARLLDGQGKLCASATSTLILFQSE